jgi:hypothetical protein
MSAGFRERAHLGEDLFVAADVSSGLALGVDPLSVDDDVEHAATSGDQPGLHAELTFDCLRQTGGDGIVVSDLAELDGDVHDSSCLSRSSKIRWETTSGNVETLADRAGARRGTRASRSRQRLVD